MKLEQRELLRIGDMMIRNPLTVSKDEAVADSVKKMNALRVGSVLVVDKERHLVGIFTERDLMTRVVASGKDPKQTLVSEAMTKNPQTISSEMPVLKAVELLQGNTFRHVPVVDGSQLLGILSVRDLQQEIQRNAQARAEALRESEERYRRLLTATTDYIYSVQVENGRAVATNHGAGSRAVSGYAEEDYAANPYLWYQMIHPEDRPKVIGMAERAVKGLTVEPIEHRFFHRDGTIRWLLDTIVVKKDGKGRVVSYDGLVRDITERKIAEEALSQSEERTRSITDAAQDAILMMDSQGKIIYWNPAGERILGYSGKEVLGLDLHRLLAPVRFHQAHDAAFPEFLRTGRGAAIGKTLELAAIRKDGVEIVVALSLSAIKRPEGWQAVGVMRDITEQKKAEERLLLIMKAFESSSDAIGVADPQGRHLYQNQAFTDLFECSAKEVEAAGIQSFFSDKGSSFHDVFNAIMNGGFWNGEIEMTSRSGRKFPALLRANAIRDGAGRICGLLGIFSDVTRSKQWEKEKEQLQERLYRSQKLESLGTMANGIAHNFNNIFGAIRGYADMAIEEVAPGSQPWSDLENVLKGIESAHQLAQQMLAFGRSSRLGVQKVDAASAVKEAIGMYKVSVKGRADIHENIGPDCGSILADRAQFQQVILNLCNNSFHACEKSRGSIEVSLSGVTVDTGLAAKYTHLREGEYVKLCVKDTGCGMDAETLRHVFEPFFTTKGPGKGTGLGLYTVHETIVGCGGDVIIHSELGKGTSVEVYLPRVQAEA